MSVCPARVQASGVGAPNHPIHLRLPFSRRVERCAPDMQSKHDGQVLLLVDVVGVQVQKHFGATDGWYPRANDAPHLGERLEEAGLLGAAAAGWDRRVDGDAAGLLAAWCCGPWRGRRCEGRR